MKVFLRLNGCEIQALVDEQERVILQVASGETDREAFRCGFAIISLQTAEDRRLEIDR